MSTGTRELAAWLRSSEGADILDDAVLGMLTTGEALEIAQEFGVSARDLRRAIDSALADGA